MNKCKQSGCAANCCKVITIIDKFDRLAIEWAHARGLEIIGDYMIIPHRCPHLNEKDECDIYETRPLSCRLWKKDGLGCKICRRMER